MNKNITTCCTLLLCLLLAAVSCQTSPKNGIPPLKTAKAGLAPKEETDNIKLKYKEACDALQQKPDDWKQYLTLATVYIMEGRITGDGTYYGNAAIGMLNKVIDSKTDNTDLVFQALSLKSAVLLNMHQFLQAQETALKGIQLNNYNSGIYGALVDADVELGHYDSAVANCDKMLSLRPDLRSYSRASYLRQIHGDNRGAIDAMKMAVEAGLPGAEQTEWARVTLGDLYLNTGSTDTAALLYQMALEYRPNYPYAEMGLAKVSKTRKQYDDAITHTGKAITIMSDPAFISFLAELYELKGDNTKAANIRKDVIKGMQEGLDEEKDALVKHNANRELAQAYLNTNALDKALQYAKVDLQMRPDNIDANELMAWILFLKGDPEQARSYADKMLVKHTQNANTLYKAAAIYTAAGDAAKGAQLKQQALAVNPNTDIHLQQQAKSF